MERIRSKNLLFSYDLSNEINHEIFTDFLIEKQKIQEIISANDEKKIYFLVKLKKTKSIESTKNYILKNYEPIIIISKDFNNGINILKNLNNYKETIFEQNIIDLSETEKISEYSSSTEKEKSFLKSFKIKEKAKKNFIEINQLILKENLLNLIDSGIIHVKEIGTFLNSKRNYKILKENENEEKENLTNELESNWSDIKFEINFSNKKRHLWIYSEPNCGKTNFKKYLKKKYYTYEYCFKESFQNPTEKTEILVFDEFRKNNLSKQDICLMCDGDFKFKQKSKETISPKIKLCVVFSNYSLKEVYQNEYDQQCLSERFNEHKATKNFNENLKISI